MEVIRHMLSKLMKEKGKRKKEKVEREKRVTPFCVASSQLFPFSFFLVLITGVVAWPPSAVAWPPSAVGGPPSAVGGPPLAVGWPLSAKVLRYARRVVQKYDENRNGQLEENEWKRMRGNPRLADFNADGLITVDEFANRVAEYGRRRHIRLVFPESNRPQDSTVAKSPEVKRRRDSKFFVPSSRLPKGLPDWFHSRDGDGDGQLTLAEFSPIFSRSAIREFRRYDLDRDGVLTAKEYLRAAAAKATPSAAPAKKDSAP